MYTFFKLIIIIFIATALLMSYSVLQKSYKTASIEASIEKEFSNIQV